jgi:E3 ubiquitin-protein ligase NEDD4
MFPELTDACRRANEESILAVQIFDQKKFKKKDQGFLGVVNVRVGSVIDLDAGGDGAQTRPSKSLFPRADKLSL